MMADKIKISWGEVQECNVYTKVSINSINLELMY